MSDGVLDPNDPRWHAKLEYTNDDDGVWLVLDKQRIELGFDPTLDDAMDAALRLDRPVA